MELCSAHFLLDAKAKEKHIRCIVMMLFFLLWVLVFFLRPSEEKSIKVFRMRGKCIYTEKMFLLRSIFDVSGPSASEFLIFLSFCLFFPVTSSRSFLVQHTHARSREREKFHATRENWVAVTSSSENGKEKKIELTDYHSPPWSHSNPSHLGNPILVFDYNMHNIDTISYDA